MSLIHDEKTKLTATWLNSIAVAALAIGAIAPIVATVTTSVTLLSATGLAMFWILIGACLHLAARMILERLKEPS